VGAVEPAPVLHEFVLAPAARQTPASCPGGICGAGGAGQNPRAIRVEDTLVPAPDVGADGQPGEGAGGGAAAAPEAELDRATQATPDRSTGADGVLSYTEVFNPGVVPFKRQSSLDSVSADWRLRLRGGLGRGLQPLEVLGSAAGGQADRDPFWGNLKLPYRPGEDLPLPSVAPSARILSYRTQPAVPVRFAKDSADNYYVRFGDASPKARAALEKSKGQVQLTFLTDAPSSYFGGQLPPGVGLNEVPAHLLPSVPPSVKAEGLAVATALRVGRHLPVATLVGRLVAYFRGFRPGDPPPPRANIYRDLALGRLGVCRHRAYAFVVTAQSLGLPARYVTNEAHAFAEVYVPRVGWRRIDLGGGALELQVHNAEDKALHQPRGGDPFEQPAGYAQQYTRLGGSVSGLSSMASRGTAGRSGSGAGGRNGAEPDPGSGDGGAAVRGPAGADGGPSRIVQRPGDGGSESADPAAASRTGRGQRTGGSEGDGDGGLSVGGDSDALGLPEPPGGGAEPATRPPSAAPPSSSPPADQTPPPAAVPTPPPAVELRTPTRVRLAGHRSSGFRGEELSLEGQIGAGRDPGEAGPSGLIVEVFLRRHLDDPGVLVGRTVTIDGGRFVGRFTIPAEVSLGDHYLVVETPGDRHHAPSRLE
jgi:hypothetical protein